MQPMSWTVVLGLGVMGVVAVEACTINVASSGGGGNGSSSGTGGTSSSGAWGASSSGVGGGSGGGGNGACFGLDEPCAATGQCCLGSTCQGGGTGQAGLCSPQCAHPGDACTPGGTDCCAGFACITDSTGASKCSNQCQEEGSTCDPTHPCCSGPDCTLDPSGSTSTCALAQQQPGVPCRTVADCTPGVVCSNGLCGGAEAGAAGACVAYGGGCSAGALPCCPGLTCGAGNTCQNDTSNGAIDIADGSTYFDGGCGSQTVAGGDPPEYHVLDMGKTSGTFSFSYNTYTIPDEIRVYYESATLFDTGCVGASGMTNLTFSGGTSTISIQVYPNCNDNTTGTAWDFTVGCPQ